MQHPPGSEAIESESQVKTLRREGNACIGLGTGVGALGVGSAVLLGATCPLCYFVAPALIGMGVYGHARARHIDRCSTSKECSTPKETLNSD